jgi:four helix bundle protein
MGNYRELTVWKRAHDLSLELYRSTNAFPAEERYGLTAQLRRAAVSVVSNIAEGSGRQGDKEQIRFLRIARGSVCEIECQLLLARDLGFLDSRPWKVLDGKCQDLSRMLTALARSLSPIVTPNPS